MMNRIEIAVALIASEYPKVHSELHEDYIRLAFVEADRILKIAAETEQKQEQPRTVAKVMREALGEELYQKWLDNKPHIGLEHITGMSASHILAYNSFDWNDSNEGRGFWDKLFDKLEAEGK